MSGWGENGQNLFAINGAATLIRVCDNVDRGRQRGTRDRHEGK